MSLVKRNNGQLPALFTDLLNIDRLFEQPLLFNNWVTGNIPAANISENEKEFLIELAVPGMKREDMKIAIENQVLTIWGEKEVKEEKSNGNGSYKRREYSYDSFSRSFELPEAAKLDNVNANYRDGVLELHIPKDERTVQTQRREVAIS